LGLQRQVSFSLVISLGLVAVFMAMVYLKGVILHWWHYFDFIFVISVTILLPLIWIFTCAALTKVAKELAGDIEKVNIKHMGT
jgi:ascorbate-specific PTS system EIIC-type component UlaA